MIHHPKKAGTGLGIEMPEGENSGSLFLYTGMDRFKQVVQSYHDLPFQVLFTYLVFLAHRQTVE